MLCILVLCISGGSYSLKSTPNYIFFEKLFMVIYLLSKFLPESVEKQTPMKYFFLFRFDVWPGARTLVLRLLSQHTTYWTTAISIFFVFHNFYKIDPSTFEWVNVHIFYEIILIKLSKLITLIIKIFSS